MISTREAKELERRNALMVQDMLDEGAFEMDVDDERDARLRVKEILRTSKPAELPSEEKWLNNPITVSFLILVFGILAFGTVIWLVVNGK